SGRLNVEIGGTTAGTTFDQLNVSGVATLDGTLTIALVNGFTPAAPDGFRVLNNANPRTGTFATITGLLFTGGRFVPFYDSTGLTLDANLNPVAVSDTPTTLEDVAT